MKYYEYKLPGNKKWLISFRLKGKPIDKQQN